MTDKNLDFGRLTVKFGMATKVKIALNLFVDATAATVLVIN